MFLCKECAGEARYDSKYCKSWGPFAISVAFVQGGFGWIVLNLVLPIAPMYVMAEYFITYFK